MRRTRAIEILERAGVPHQVATYESEGFASAVEVAQKLKLPADAVFRTLVVRGERTGIVLALVPGAHSLSLRKLAQLMGDKRADMIDPSDVPRLTGYIRGGVSPLGGKRAYPTFLDQSARQHDRIAVSAGVRGVQILIAPAELARVTRATVADLVE